MNILVVYGSEYGTTKRYAKKFCQLTNLPLVNYQIIDNLSGYDLIVHFGGLYAGGVKGLKKTCKALKDNQKLIIVTVGLADVNDPTNINNIKDSLKRQVSKKRLINTPCFHLRGGIDYQKLNFKHRTMMALLYRKVVKLPEDKKTGEIKALIDTYNKKVDFVDFDALNQIIDEVNSFK